MVQDIMWVCFFLQKEDQSTEIYEKDLLLTINNIESHSGRLCKHSDLVKAQLNKDGANDLYKLTNMELGQTKTGIKMPILPPFSSTEPTTQDTRNLKMIWKIINSGATGIPRILIPWQTYLWTETWSRPSPAKIPRISQKSPLLKPKEPW